MNSDVSELKHYNGEVTLYYDAKHHVRYVLEDGEKIMVPGVTNITGMVDKSQPLMAWSAAQTVELLRTSILPGQAYTEEQLEEAFQNAKRNYRNTSRKALDIGKLAHEWLDRYQQSLIAGVDHEESLPENENAANCVKAALDFMGKHSFSPFRVETHVYSRLYNYAGTLDHLAHITSCGSEDCCPFEGTVFILGDFKSSKAMYDEYFLQTAAYQQAIQEEFPDLTVDGRLILRLDKEGQGFEHAIRLNNTMEDDLTAFLGAQEILKWQKQIDYDASFNKKLIKLAKAASKPPARPRKKTVIREVATAIPIGE